MQNYYLDLDKGELRHLIYALLLFWLWITHFFAFCIDETLWIEKNVLDFSGSKYKQLLSPK